MGEPRIEHVLNIEPVVDRIRFVTCGRRGTDPFQFKEFVSIYQWQVWVIFAIFLLVLTTTVLLFQKPAKQKVDSIYNFIENSVRSSMPIIKGVLEQGDPFAANILSVQRLRWLLAGFLLGAQVLSNGYKNTNVYNMITSRKPLLIDKFEHVVSEQSALYCRTGNV